MTILEALALIPENPNRAKNELKQIWFDFTRPFRSHFWNRARLKSESEKAPYWKRACDPKLDVKAGRAAGYDL